MKYIVLFNQEQLGDLFWCSGMEKDYLCFDYETDFWSKFSDKNPLNNIRTKFEDNH